ncbi:MAG: CHC2 zinc finger domain-containing protein [Parabacteroides sp.]|nr:CHC2 zinc finger domain-containing protein [Parabacteroides sp.]
MLTDDTLRKVRETARIDEVASAYLTLHRSGKDLVALCPFHDERHPSFRVSPAKNIGKCFSCAEAADSIRLVRHMEGCGFEEAVRLLARKYGIEVEETAGARDERRDEREALLRANEAFAHGLLPPGGLVGTTRAEEDGERLREAYRSFGVGLCPPDVPKAFRPFLNRLVFPIRTTGGQVAGFAGRRLTPAGKESKYVNSPDSPAYHKGHILYGLHEAVKAVRSEGRVLLCEGYKDVLAYHAAGIRYAAGLCGTALTEEHIRMIRRLTQRVTLSLDPDPAGRLNTVRCAHRLLAAGCAVDLLLLPDGMDPDEVYRQKGSDELARLAQDGTRDYLSYRVRQAASRPRTDTAAISGVLGEIKLLASPLAVYNRLGELSGATGIPVEVLRQETRAIPGPGDAPSPAPAKEPAGDTPVLPGERALLRFCLTHHDRIFYDTDGNKISLPAWVRDGLTDNDLPLKDPGHARLLHLLAEGKHPDGIADEGLSALILSLRASAPPDTGPIPAEGLPAETYSRVLLYAESFAHREIAHILESLRTATTPDERLRLQAALEDRFAQSDQIAKELKSQSIIPEGR